MLLIIKFINPLGNHETTTNYKDFLLKEDPDFLMEFSKKNLEYSLDKIKMLVEPDSKIPHMFERMPVNVSLNQFKKILTNDPYFSIPLFSKILMDFGNEGKGMTLLSTIFRGKRKEAFWLASGLNEFDNFKNTRFSLPYINHNQVLFFGEGGKISVQGNTLGFSSLTEKGENFLEIETFYAAKIDGTFSFLSENLLNKTIHAYRDLLVFPEKIFRILKNRKDDILSIMDQVNDYELIGANNFIKKYSLKDLKKINSKYSYFTLKFREYVKEVMTLV